MGELCWWDVGGATALRVLGYLVSLSIEDPDLAFRTERNGGLAALCNHDAVAGNQLRANTGRHKAATFVDCGCARNLYNLGCMIGSISRDSANRDGQSHN